MNGHPYRVLFLSQRNSARSMMAEAIANSIGRGQIEAFSAGVRPASVVDPMASELLEHAGLEVPDHPPQHVREFSAPDSPPRCDVAELDRMGADFAVHGDDITEQELERSFPGLMAAGRMKLVPYTATISSRQIVARIADRLREGTLRVKL